MRSAVRCAFPSGAISLSPACGARSWASAAAFVPFRAPLSPHLPREGTRGGCVGRAGGGCYVAEGCGSVGGGGGGGGSGQGR